MATSFPSAAPSPMDRARAVARPAGVTIVVILTWLSALADVLGGVGFLANAEDRSMRHDLGLTTAEMRWSGAVMIALGVVTALVAYGLGRGADWARTVVALVMCLHIVSAVFALTQVSWESQRNEAWAAIAQVGLSLLVILALFSARADRWFASRN
ncbi:MAG TPA: hypothetical protein VIL36_04455 [Acidimicrobiales bacterium]